MFEIRRYKKTITTINSNNFDDCKDFIMNMLKDEKHCINLGIDEYVLHLEEKVVLNEEVESSKHIFRIRYRSGFRFSHEYLFTVYNIDK